MKRKILVTTGTRADYGVLRPLLERIKNHKKLELIFVVTGTHFSKKHGYTVNEIKKDGLPIHAKFSIIPKDDTNYSMSLTLGQSIIKLTKIFQRFKPDINLVIGDRDEMLASAIVSSHLNIPTAHIHGGDISGGLDEYNRHAITKLSNIHFAPTKKSLNRIIKLGENPKNVFNTGALAFDEIKQKRITGKNMLEEKFNVSFKKPIILLVFHPDTTESDQSGVQIQKILKAIVMSKNSTVAIAPNSDTGNKKIFQHLRSYSKKNNFIQIYPNVSRSDYLGLLENCSVLIGNSSSGIIESSWFNIPVINLGLRQKNREKGENVLDLENPTIQKIHHEIEKIVNKKKRKIGKKSIYGNGKSSEKIVRHLLKIALNKKLLQKQITY